MPLYIILIKQLMYLKPLFLYMTLLVATLNSFLMKSGLYLIIMMHMTCLKTLLRKLLDWLSLCSDRFKKKEFQFVSEVSYIYVYNVSNYVHISCVQSVVKQTNGSDCGVFTCKVQYAIV